MFTTTTSFIEIYSRESLRPVIHNKTETNFPISEGNNIQGKDRFFVSRGLKIGGKAYLHLISLRRSIVAKSMQNKSSKSEILLLSL